MTETLQQGESTPTRADAGPRAQALARERGELDVPALPASWT